MGKIFEINKENVLLDVGNGKLTTVINALKLSGILTSVETIIIFFD